MDGRGFRIEEDLLGKVEVPAEALYGAQTQRAVVNFPLRGERTIGSYRELVIALLAVKTAAARANVRAGLLAPAVGDAIVAAAASVPERELFDEFPIHRLHGGGGTSANMNVNEVLANAAEELLGGRRGEYRLVRPNDDVNLNQSTNDAYPTACHVALVKAWEPLSESLGQLASELRAKGAGLSGAPRLARTCLQDAVPATWSALFGGWASLVERGRDRAASAVDRLHAVNLGGTVMGDAADVPAAYLEAVIPALREATGDPRYEHAADLYDAAQNPDDVVNVASQLGLLARGLVKIARDLRLLSSGPEGGLGELRLPPRQPGSSAMPGKVNPVIPEFVVQLGLSVVGRQAACEAAIDHGELDLNVWESLVLFETLDAMGLLGNAADTLAAFCVSGITADREVNARHATTLIPTLSRLSRQHGYGVVTAACKQAGSEPSRIREALASRGWEVPRER